MLQIAPSIHLICKPKSQQSDFMKNLIDIAKNFEIEGEILAISPINSGLINSTYLLKTQDGSPDYILQKKNPVVFPNIPAMMDNIEKVTLHIKNKVKIEGGNPEREVMTVIPTKGGALYFEDEEKNFWTVSLFIPNTISYEKATNELLARRGGEGIGKFQRQLEDFKEPLYPTIEGFHDMAFRFRQWDDALKNGRKDRLQEVAKEIEWVEKRRPKIEEFWKLVETGVLPKRVTHNDTKLSNILFDKEGNVLCVIDLDTVMNNTPLADFGDAIRSFANTGAEDDKDLDNVNLDLTIYKAYKDGYLQEAGKMLNKKELEYLPFAPQYITYEQVMRFLMDYIQGDTYYKINYPDHNLVRTRAQMKLLESMEENESEMK